MKCPTPKAQPVPNERHPLELRATSSIHPASASSVSGQRFSGAKPVADTAPSARARSFGRRSAKAMMREDIAVTRAL